MISYWLFDNSHPPRLAGAIESCANARENKSILSSRRGAKAQSLNKIDQLFGLIVSLFFLCALAGDYSLR
ncbi:MAG TPA: hypothetical protein DDW65_19945 [Firmicutes bacterium]|nr:hypothetical protein [Bacillota bacterium]